jgi:hypothetical protein
VADPEGFNGDFTAKPGVFVVLPDGDFITEMSLTLIDG